jgi:uncharacterized protein with von Willebrand factor type A (vWA) domain
MFAFNVQWQNLLTFDEALQRHGMLREAAERLAKQAKEKAVAQDTAKLIVAHMQDAWNEALGMGDPDSAMASALRGVVPLDYVPLLRMRSGIPAAYLLARLVDALLTHAQFGHDLEDDFVLRKAAKEAFEKFEWTRQNAEKLEEGFGFDRSDAWAQLRKVEDRSGQVNDTMKQIASLAGRMFKAFQYEAIPSKCRDPQEIDGVEQGGDVERMLDDEAASMGIDPEVAVRVSEERAHQYQMAGESTKNRGPLVVAIDESGSMHEHREIWSKACAVALTRVALAEGRAVRIVHFSTATDVHDVRPGNADDMRMVAESHVAGGTDIETAFNVALNQTTLLAKDDKEGADIVFITDGLSSYSEAPFKRMQRQGVQLWTVAIDIDIRAVSQAHTHYRGHGAAGWLYDYARAYVHLDQATIAAAGDQAIKAAVQLKTAALDNDTRQRMGDAG